GERGRGAPSGRRRPHPPPQADRVPDGHEEQRGGSSGEARVRPSRRIPCEHPPRGVEPRRPELADRGRGGGGAHGAVTTPDAEAFRRLTESRPVWTRVLPAAEALPVVDERTLLHAGP